MSDEQVKEAPEQLENEAPVEMDDPAALKKLLEDERAKSTEYLD